MPNIKSASKRVLISRENNARNKAARSILKTDLKKFDTAIAEGNREAAEIAYKVAVKSIDHAANKHIIHKNNAANKKSALTKALNAMA